MSRAHAVCRTGSTKMSALLSFSMLRTSYSGNSPSEELWEIEPCNLWQIDVNVILPFYSLHGWSSAGWFSNTPQPDPSAPAPLLPPHRAAGSGTNSHYWSFETKTSHYASYQDSECYLISALELQLRVEPVVQRRLLQNDTDLALAVWRETLETQTHTRSYME